MTSIIVVLAIVFSITSIISPLFYGDKVNNYVKKQKGKLISSELQQRTFSNNRNINKEIIIKYKDQHNNTKQVSLYYLGPFSYFGEDIIIKYSQSSPEYNEIKEKQVVFEKKAIEFTEVDYKITNDEILTIRQEYTQPNVGEFAFINNNPAPSGKYKIGLFTNIYVENGVISDIR